MEIGEYEIRKMMTTVDLELLFERTSAG